MKWIEVQSANAVVLREGDVGPVKPARLVFTIDGTYAFQVMLKTVKTGDWKFSDKPMELMGILDSTLSEKPSGSVALTSDSHVRRTVAAVLSEAGCLCKTDRIMPIHSICSRANFSLPLAHAIRF